MSPLATIILNLTYFFQISRNVLSNLCKPSSSIITGDLNKKSSSWCPKGINTTAGFEFLNCFYKLLKTDFLK